jgi:hypothetical protein
MEKRRFGDWLLFPSLGGSHSETQPVSTDTEYLYLLDPNE